MAAGDERRSPQSLCVNELSDLLGDIAVGGTRRGGGACASTSRCRVDVNAFPRPKLRRRLSDDTDARGAHAALRKRSSARCQQWCCRRGHAPYTLPAWRRRNATTAAAPLTTARADYARRQTAAGIADAHRAGARLELYGGELRDMLVLPNVDVSAAFAAQCFDHSNGAKKRGVSPAGSGGSGGTASSSRRCGVEAVRHCVPPPSISVDELAAYFEDYFHLPKKMSVMADNMYA